MHVDNAEIPVRKDAEREGPIPSAWRPVLSRIVEALADHDYCLNVSVAGVAPVSAKTAEQIRCYIQNYGATLTALPDEVWNTSVCIWMGDHWDALIDLWTDEEGSSDLVLQVRISESDGAYVVDLHMVYVP
jgi:hypothetical protein